MGGLEWGGGDGSAGGQISPAGKGEKGKRGPSLTLGRGCPSRRGPGAVRGAGTRRGGSGKLRQAAGCPGGCRGAPAPPAGAATRPRTAACTGEPGRCWGTRPYNIGDGCFDVLSPPTPNPAAPWVENPPGFIPGAAEALPQPVIVIAQVFLEELQRLRQQEGTLHRRGQPGAGAVLQGLGGAGMEQEPPKGTPRDGGGRGIPARVTHWGWHSQRTGRRR